MSNTEPNNRHVLIVPIFSTEEQDIALIQATTAIVKATKRIARLEAALREIAEGDLDPGWNVGAAIAIRALLDTDKAES